MATPHPNMSWSGVSFSLMTDALPSTCCFIAADSNTHFWRISSTFFSFFFFTSQAAGTGPGTIRTQNLFTLRCVQGPGRGKLSADAEQQENDSHAHSDPHRQQVPPVPPRPRHRSTRVFCSRYLTVTEHQPRHQRNAIASPHSYIQKLGLGGGE